MPDPRLIDIAQAMRRHEHAIAERVTEEFLRRNSDWLDRYGERARTAGIEDARFHVQFLSAAVENDSPGAFRDYVRWTTGVLEARRIDRAFLAENLVQVRAALAAALPPEQFAAIDRYFALPEPVGQAEASPTDDSSPLALTRRIFVQALLRGERRAAVNIATEALRNGASMPDLYVDVFQEALYEVGRRWERNVISVAQEHMATAVTQFVMAQMYEHIPPSAATRGKAVLTGVPGEMHHVGALMVADMLEAHGWEAQYLGSNLPVPSVIGTLRDTTPDVLGISVTMLFNLHHATRLIKEVRELGRPIRIVVGGGAFRVRQAWRDIGADDYAPDLRSAVSLLCS
jgi:methanogenic corrinoid protein MtbC1